jgi:hypothetical protein
VFKATRISSRPHVDTLGVKIGVKFIEAGAKWGLRLA